RRLARNAGFTTAAVLTLALGIGGTTAIFSVVNGVLLRPLPYPQPEEVMQIRHVDASGNSQLNVSFPNYVDLRDANRSFEAMGAYSAWSRTVAAGSGAARIEAADVSEGFFDALGVLPMLGRQLLPDEIGTPGAGVAIVSYGYWQNRLGGGADL